METVLIVEDDPSGAQLLATVLKMEGYEAVQLDNWIDPTLDVEQHRPDMIIMDVRLRNRSGFDVLRQIRAHPDPQIASTPVLMTSAEDHRARSKLAGANGFMDKPFSIAALVDAVRQIKEGNNNNH